MKVSIITPVYNDVRIGRALNSLRKQQCRYDIESIVVDAYSSDETLDILERYKEQIDLLISEPDLGLYYGMNKGLTHATGDVIGILNADDCYADEHVIQDVANVFLENQKLDCCYGNVIYLDPSGRVTRYWRSCPSRAYKWRLGWRPPHPPFFVRRRIYERYGYFRTDLPIAADYEIQLRFLFKHNISAQHLDRVLVYMAPGGMSGGSIRNIIRANYETIHAWRCNQFKYATIKIVPMLKPLHNVLGIFKNPPHKDLQNIRCWGRW